MESQRQAFESVNGCEFPGKLLLNTDGWQDNGIEGQTDWGRGLGVVVVGQCMNGSGGQWINRLNGGGGQWMDRLNGGGGNGWTDKRWCGGGQ